MSADANIERQRRNDSSTSTEHVEEAASTWYDAFLAECRHIDPSCVFPSTGRGDEAGLTLLNKAAFEQGRAALCLSGGGIRSASFAVGVIQGLAQRGLIQCFDYMSTVSGGGFAGGWLSAWLHRAGTPRTASGQPAPDAHALEAEGRAMASDALAQLQGQPGADDVEPWPVTRLRLYTRYLSPKTGFFSADFWGLIATMLRNTLLNWAVLLPLLAAAMLVPRFQFALLHLLEQEVNTVTSVFDAVDFWTLVVAVVAYGIAFVHIAVNLPSYGNRGQSEPQFVAWCLLPLSIGTLALTYYWATWGQFDLTPAQFAAGGAAVNVGIWMVTGFVTGTRPFRPRTWVAAALSGAIWAVIFQAVLTRLFDYDDLSRVYVTFAFPLIMGAVLLHAVVFVGLAGREMTAADLEWWSRASAWMLIVGLTWLGVCSVAFGVPYLFDRLVEWAPNAIHGIGVATGLLGAVTSWLLRPTGEGGGAPASWLRRMALALAAPLAVVLIIGGVATVDRALVKTVTAVGDRTAFLLSIQTWPICLPSQEAEYSRNKCHPADGGFGETGVVFAALIALALLTSRLIPANKFSLHDMYHNRLTRAYLGASRHEREPNRFTGFDPRDDVELSALANQRPLHIVNTTLNMRLDPRLGRQESRALSFTFSPLHCGSNALRAYRPSAEFAFDPLRKRGVTLGTAMTVSGAAASPQMGEFTSPALAFLLALFNARLGVWLGNPASAGHDAWRARDPRARIAPILREMLGWTTDANPYVFLSDGGHYDNLGLSEMVLRRVRHIVIVDSGCDPKYEFKDLATAVRRARVDHGAEITFDAAAMNALRDDPLKPHAVTGTIQYLEAAPGDAGSIVYIKPGLSNDESVDILTYRKAHPEFPHESTANQWFTEAQFESYRALGFHSLQAALADESALGLGHLAKELLVKRMQMAKTTTIGT
jgi:hypothetical protein